jgi:hypothetical protein
MRRANALNERIGGFCGEMAQLQPRFGSTRVADFHIIGDMPNSTVCDRSLATVYEPSLRLLSQARPARHVMRSSHSEQSMASELTAIPYALYAGAFQRSEYYPTRHVGPPGDE